MFRCWGFRGRGVICLGLPWACCWWKGFWPWCIMGRGSLTFSCCCWWWANSCLWCCWCWCWCMGWWDGKGSWCGSWETGGPCIKPYNIRERRQTTTWENQQNQNLLLHIMHVILISFFMTEIVSLLINTHLNIIRQFLYIITLQLVSSSIYKVVQQ